MIPEQMSTAVDLSPTGVYTWETAQQIQTGKHMTPATFAQRLQQLREEAGLSQYALAKKTGLTKQAVSRLELGQREPSWRTVQLLAAALGASCEAFTDPGLHLPEEKPPAPRGRPRKSAVEAPAEQTAPEKPPRGKASKGKRAGKSRGET
jgi:transcriptional regulator with XRE-family HTH domain